MSGTPLNIIGLEECNEVLPEIDEHGNDPLENAKIKALAYFKATGKPVFSCDSGLYFENVPEKDQPGVHVRNVSGKHLTDDEMVCHYATLATNYGGKLHAKYKNAICLVMNEDEIYEYMGEDLHGEAFYIAGQPHTKRVAGFPLDCLSLHIDTGKYYYDLEKADRAANGMAGFSLFFERIFGWAASRNGKVENEA